MWFTRPGCILLLLRGSLLTLALQLLRAVASMGTVSHGLRLWLCSSINIKLWYAVFLHCSSIGTVYAFSTSNSGGWKNRQKRAIPQEVDQMLGAAWVIFFLKLIQLNTDKVCLLLLTSVPTEVCLAKSSLPIPISITFVLLMPDNGITWQTTQPALFHENMFYFALMSRFVSLCIARVQFMSLAW